MNFFRPAILLIAVLVFSAFPALAQENEPIVIDEVVAQINDGVLTLSRINREVKELREALIQQGKKPEEAAAEAEKKKGELIASLINEELLVQKGKEIGVENDVEGQINQRFLQMMKENNIKSLEVLFTEMRKANVNPDEIKEVWRKQITKEAVLYREVDQKTYWGTSAKELRDYWEKNKAKFTKPEKVALSEIFLNFAGRDENAVREKAKQLVEQLRKGESFEKLAVENSDRPDIQKNKGKIGKFEMPQLAEGSPKIAAEIKKTAVGGVTDPIEVRDRDEGMEIFRVDEREAASLESVFDEDAVRRAVSIERTPEARKNFMAELYKNAYIELAEGYKALVMPFLNNQAVAEAKKTDK